MIIVLSVSAINSDRSNIVQLLGWPTGTKHESNVQI
jgi:hypothetical protein